MSGEAKARILRRVTEQGHTESYGHLLYMAAGMGFDPVQLGPESYTEFTAWAGHFEGLRAALLCLAMFERRIGPEPAAEIVDQHIADAITDLQPGNGSGTRGE